MNGAGIIGIDTIKLKTALFNLAPDVELIPNGPKKNNRTGNETGKHPLFRDQQGQMVYGSNAYYNGPFYNIDLKWERSGKEERQTVTIHTSIPKLCGVNNAVLLNAKQTVKALDDLMQDIADTVGVTFNIDDCDLSRVDLARNIEPSKPWDYYRPVYTGMNAKYKQLRDYGSTCLWSVNNEQLCAYLKQPHLIKIHADTVGTTDKTQRLELRYMNKAAIKKAFGFDTIADLKRNIDALSDVYLNGVQKRLFKQEIEKIFNDWRGNNMNAYERVEQYCKRTYGRKNWKQKTDRILADWWRLENTGVDGARTIRDRQADCRTDGYKLSKRMIETEHLLKRLNIGNSGHLTDLYNEVRGLVLDRANVA